MEKPSFNSLDILKFVIAFGVVAIHCNIQDYSPLLRKVCDLAVPLFFLMSGYLLFKNVNRGGYAKRYIMKLCRLYVLWSVIYLPFAVLGYHEWGMGIVKSTVCYIRDFLFMGQHYMSWQLWYLLALIYGVCMIKWFMKMRISLEGCVIIGVQLTFIGMLMTTINDATLHGGIISSLVTGYFELFRTVRNGIFNGFLFIVLGMLLCKHQERLEKISLYAKISVLVVAVIAYYMKIPFALHLLSFSILYWVLQIRIPNRSYFLWMRNVSTLVYFSHMLFVTLIKYTLPSFESVCEKWLCASVASVLFSAVILRMAKSEKYSCLYRLIGK